MIQIHATFRIKNKEIAAKVIEGEAIIINLATGTYYSTDNAGAFAWGLVEAGHSLGAMTTAVRIHFGVPAETDVEADLRTFLGHLLAENLIEACPPLEPSPAASEITPAGVAYAPPQLNAYRDMDDMLALDPPVPGLEPIPWSDPESKR